MKDGRKKTLNYVYYLTTTLNPTVSAAAAHWQLQNSKPAQCMSTTYYSNFQSATLESDAELSGRKLGVMNNPIRRSFDAPIVVGLESVNTITPGIRTSESFKFEKVERLKS